MDMDKVGRLVAPPEVQPAGDGDGGSQDGDSGVMRPTERMARRKGQILATTVLQSEDELCCRRISRTSLKLIEFEFALNSPVLDGAALLTISVTPHDSPGLKPDTGRFRTLAISGQMPSRRETGDMRAGGCRTTTQGDVTQRSQFHSKFIDFNGRLTAVQLQREC